jgi:Uri superfamily endonuclease
VYDLRSSLETEGSSDVCCVSSLFKPKESQFFQVLQDPCANKSSLLFAALGNREEEREELLRG